MTGPIHIGHNLEDHLEDILDMVNIGSSEQRKLKRVILTCYYLRTSLMMEKSTQYFLLPSLFSTAMVIHDNKLENLIEEAAMGAKTVE